ncbi:hypothetical protein [Pseudomonas monteilii]|uniref:Uncharacterized protein n=1 Tax=Pseudomonas monteilii TaxID=76759 RepID=A0A399M1K0_9PSED|nr:hypothetical protein [Pseudomonas monteilii]RII75628.1 hypothetical protein D0894_21635 [Pseudomonas monteilii]
MNTKSTTSESRKPGFVAKTRKGTGEQAVYERIGVAWKNADGSFYIKLAGTQVVSDFMLYEIESTESAAE